MSWSRRLPVILLLGLMSSCASQDPVALDLRDTRPVGQGPAFRPPAVLRTGPVGILRCERTAGKPYGAHIELFARDRGVLVPAGIGIGRGGCLYPLRTVDPTGVVEVDPGAVVGVPTLGELFELWGQPLSPRRLAGFKAGAGLGVIAFVDGRRWQWDPRGIPLRRHAQIVIELDASVQPHPTYAFPPGL